MTVRAMQRTTDSNDASHPEQPRGGWLRRLSGYALRHRRNLIIAFTAAALGTSCRAVVPLIARQIVDNVIGTGEALWPWLAALIGLALFAFAMAYLRRYRGGQVALNVQYDLRNAMHEHLLEMDQHSLARLPTGQLVARAISDSNLVQGLLSFLPIVSGSLLMMLISLGIMLYLSPLLALISVALFPTLFVVAYRMRRQLFPASWDGQQREGDVAQIVDEAVNGVRIVKAFAQERRELGRLTDAAGTLYGSRMRVVRLQSRYQPVLKTVPMLAQVAVLAFGGWLALRGTISVGTFLAFSTYVAQFVAPARMLAGILTIGQRARAGVERIFQLLDLRSAVTDAPMAVDLDAVRGEVEFRDVHFGYDEHPVLDDVTLHVAPGERVAFVGSSGSGKSTLTSLVSRFHDPTSGSVLVDGHDVRGVTLRSLRRRVGVAFEDSFLFSDSVRDNIAYGRPGAGDAEIEAAARAARAHEFITALPHGYHTPVGERGFTLSGGQRQRIALARAILSDPAILVLDDATSAVDATTEEAIHDALRDVLAWRTTLLIAHRLSSLRLADRIVLLENGHIADQGTHAELSERSAAYRALVSGFTDEAAGAGTDGPDCADGAHVDGRPAGSAADAAQPAHGHDLAASLEPSQHLIAQVDALPPVRDVPDVDLAREARRTRTFTLGRLLHEFRRPLLIGLVLVVLDAVAGVAGPILVKTGIDDGVRATSTAVLLAASGIYLVIVLADLLDQVGETFVTGRTAERAMLSLRVRIWAQLQRLSLDYYEREMAGRIMTRMTTDVDQFESLIQNGLLNALVAFVTFLGVGVALLVLNWELGLCTLSVVIPLTAATIWFRRRASRLYDITRERVAILNANFQESLSGARESQAFAHENPTIEKFRALNGNYLRSRVAAQRLVATYFPFVQFLSSVADAIVLGLGAYLIGRGELTKGGLIAFILYISMFFSPIQQLSQVFDSWQRTLISARRIRELMGLETSTPEADQPEPVPALSGRIELRDVRFVYPAKPEAALRGVSLRVDPGETVALVGETGAGKSTVMKLLARFYDPSSGALEVDGRTLSELDLAQFRGRLGYVPQEPFLFSGTIRDNIAYGRPSASDAEVEAAARSVGAHEFVASLPNGYRHELRERGRSLSAGQRQLVALARAELVDPAILLLDEATSNLDLVTEAKVTAAMHRITRTRTSVLIAHRLQTARSADRIVVMDEGTIVEDGSHHELLAANGRYAGMWRAFDLAEVR